MCLCMYVAMSENRFLRFLLLILFDPELVYSFVENKNSDIKLICSDLHIFCHNVYNRCRRTKTNVHELERKGQTIREDQNGTFSDDSVNIGKLISTKTNVRNTTATMVSM
jgi:hypothetical protein